jgi:trehalose 6-phosphate synthase/phosphatase
MERNATQRDATGSRKVILGIDRLDYIKGIPHKLYAFGRFLQMNPR